MTDERSDEGAASGAWSSEPETSQLRRLQTAMSEAELAVARRIGLGSTDLSAMSHLTFTPDTVGPGWLAQRLGLTPGAVTEVVDRLERAGHLERRRDTNDRRRVQLVPTASAMSEVGVTLKPLLQILDEQTRRFDPGERAVIQRFLVATIAAYEDFAEDQRAEQRSAATGEREPARDVVHSDTPVDPIIDHS